MMSLPIRLSNNSREPIYHQIEKQIKALIAGGLLEEGAILPSIRILSKDLKVSVITTRRAYQNLEAQGFIHTVQGRGTFVAEVDQVQKDQVKETNVTQAFENAIETAYRYDYTKNEIEDFFMNMLKEFNNKGEK